MNKRGDSEVTLNTLAIAILFFLGIIAIIAVIVKILG